MSTGKFGGETVFAGHGAGGDLTAVAVVSHDCDRTLPADEWRGPK